MDAVQRVEYGAGIRRQVASELARLGKARALVLTTPEQSALGQEISEYLDAESGAKFGTGSGAKFGAKSVGVYSAAAMHTPVEVTQDALGYAQSVGADSLIAVGGGSTIGLAKALALRTELVQIAIPTTYAGSEATPILGQTEDGVKTTLKDSRVLPQTVLYDPELVVTLPKILSATSGLNAMAHAAEALYAKDRTPETTQLALQGLEAFAKGLLRVMETPDDLAAREATQRGAWACGNVLGRVGMALHHKLCHTLGGSFDLPHAQTHAVVLPHAIAYNEVSVPDLLKPVAELLGGKQAGTALWSFAKSLAAPLTLAELGMRDQDLEQAADLATQNPYWNPREMSRAGVLSLLKNAQAGSCPSDYR